MERGETCIWEARWWLETVTALTRGSTHRFVHVPPTSYVELGSVPRRSSQNGDAFLASRIPLEIQDILLRDTRAVIPVQLTQTFAGRRPLSAGESSAARLIFEVLGLLRALFPVL